MWRRTLDLVRRPRPARRAALRCEPLEDRRVPATYLVTNLADGGPGSLRQAVLDANANAGTDDIQFTGAGAAGSITLTTGQLELSDPVTITGPGAAALAVSGNDQSRVFRVNTGGAVTISGLTLTRGNADSGGAIRLEAGGTLTLTAAAVTASHGQAGGGINAGPGSDLTVRDTTIAGNSATFEGGGVWADTATVLVENCTVSGNESQFSFGGGFYLANWSHTVRNTTVSGNRAFFYGGGVFTTAGDTLVQNCTVVGNLSGPAYGGGGLYLYGGASLDARLTVQSTIAAGNAGGDVTNNITNYFYPSILNLDHSLVGTYPDGLNGTDTANLFGVDPQLGPLSDNGGPTWTHPLAPTSPALGAGSNPAGLATDQRGEPRVQNGAPDIGAVEGASDLAVTHLEDDLEPGSLRRAVNAANARPGVNPIFFVGGLTGTITLTAGDLPLSESVAIAGPGTDVITVAGDANNRAFTDLSGGTLALAIGGLTIRNPAGVSFPYPVTLADRLAIDVGPAGASFTNRLDLATHELTVDGGVRIGSGGTLTGSGTVLGPLAVEAGGTLTPGGAGGGSFVVTGDFTVAPGGIVVAQLGSDAVAVHGAVALGTGTNFDLSLGFSPLPGHTFDLVINPVSGPGSLTGRLNGIADHRYLTLNGTHLQVRYDDGDLTLVANQAPALDPAVPVALPTILEDTPGVSNPGLTVDALVGTPGLYADPQGKTPGGVAAVGAAGADGAWQFSLDGGQTWAPFGDLGPAAATVLEADGAGKNRVRFVPAANASGAAALSFRAWDAADGRPSGTAGVDASAGGGNTAFGTQTGTAAISVLAVNDPPTAVNDTAALAEDGGEQDIFVRANDSSGPEAGETLSVVAVTQGQHGTVRVVTAPDGVGTHVTYEPGPDFTGTDFFLYTLADGGGGTSLAAVTVTVTNDAADRLEVVTAPGPWTFTEGDAPTPIDAGLAVGSADEQTVLGATVRIASGFVARKDVLALPAGAADPAIRARYDVRRGVLSLTGAASPAAYEAALRAVTYGNASPAPVDGVRTVAVQVRDAAGVGEPAYVRIKVVGVNSGPQVTLRATSVAYKAGSPAVAAVPVAAITDLDNTRLQGATVQIGGLQPGDALTINKLTSGRVSGISFSYNAGTLALSGSATLATYLKVLKLIKFSATGGAGVTRTLTLTVTDGVDATAAPPVSVNVT